jgi:hypothetical protein
VEAEISELVIENVNNHNILLETLPSADTDLEGERLKEALSFHLVL